MTVDELKEATDKTNNQIMEEIKDIKNDVIEVKLAVAALPQTLEKHFASKTTEKLVYACVGLILITVVGYVINSSIQEKDRITIKEVKALIEENNDKQFENYIK